MSKFTDMMDEHLAILKEQDDDQWKKYLSKPLDIRRFLRLESLRELVYAAQAEISGAQFRDLYSPPFADGATGFNRTSRWILYRRGLILGGQLTTRGWKVATRAMRWRAGELRRLGFEHEAQEMDRFEEVSSYLATGYFRLSSRFDKYKEHKELKVIER